MNFWGPGSGVYGRGRWRGEPASPLAGPSPRKSFRRLLVIHFGQLGDTVLSLPALDLLREHFPNDELTLGCGMPAHELLDLWGRADKIVPLDRVKVRDTNPVYAAWLICQFVSRIWHPTPDAVVVMHPNDEMYLVAYCTAAKRRAGVVVKPGFFSRLLNEPYEGLWKGLHASASYLAFVRQFCGIAPPEHEAPPVPRLELAQPPHRNGRIAIHVGGSRKAKRMTPELWLEVARGLRIRTGKEIAFISGPEEPELAHELSRSMEGAMPLANLSIEALAREVAQSGFFVGTDSGPGHMAAALQTPSLTLIERHVAPRYSTLGAHARQLAHSGIKTLGAADVVQAALAHPSFPMPEGRA